MLKQQTSRFSGPPSLSSNCLGGEILYRRLQWLGTNAVLDTNWLTVSPSVAAYRDYFDLMIKTNMAAPQATASNGVPISLREIGSRLTTAVVRNGSLWTCQAVGLSGTNGNYVGDQTGSSVDRSSVQWTKLSVETSTGTLSYNSHGRIWDPAPTNAYWYYFPSLMVNCAGDMLAGFSGSRATSYIGTFYAWRVKQCR